MILKKNAAYTLIEVLIGLAVFATVVVPLLLFFSRDSMILRDRNAMIAVSLLDQESVIALANPESVTPIKLRSVNGIEWRIESESQGDKLKFLTLKAFRLGKQMGIAKFYVYKE